MSKPHPNKLRGLLLRAPSSTFGESLLGWWRPGFLRYMAHLERLPSVEITSYHLIWAPDNLKVSFTYKTFPLEIAMHDGDLSVFAKDGTPNEVFEEVATHLRNYHWVWPWQALCAGWRYSPVNPANRHGS